MEAHPSPISPPGPPGTAAGRRWPYVLAAVVAIALAFGAWGAWRGFAPPLRAASRAAATRPVSVAVASPPSRSVASAAVAGNGKRAMKSSSLRLSSIRPSRHCSAA